MPAAKSQNSIRVEGLNRCLRILSKLPKDMQAEIRDESQAIATEEMVPAWQAAARQSGPMGEKQAASVRAKRDRVPAVSIGYARKTYSGGASTIMSRYPSHAGGGVRGMVDVGDQVGADGGVGGLGDGVERFGVGVAGADIGGQIEDVAEVGSGNQRGHNGSVRSRMIKRADLVELRRGPILDQAGQFRGYFVVVVVREMTWDRTTIFVGFMSAWAL